LKKVRDVLLGKIFSGTYTCLREMNSFI